MSIIDHECSPRKVLSLPFDQAGPSTSTYQNVPTMECCSVCTQSNKLTELRSCVVCSYKYCEFCLSKHNQYIQTINSQYPNVCRNHNKELNLFCTGLSCNNLICEECVEPNHKNHDQVSTTEQADMLKNENQRNLNEINSIIRRLTSKKTTFENDVIIVKSNIEERQKNLSKYVEELCYAQYEKLSALENDIINPLNAEIGKLKKIERDLKHLIQSHSHFLHHKVIQFYQFKQFPIKFEFENPLLKHKTLIVKPAMHEISNFSNVENFIGKVDLFVNDKIFTKTYEYASVNNVVYESTTESVHDICFYRKHLYILENSSQKWYIKQLKGIDFVKKIELQISLDPSYSVQMGVLSDNRIVLLYQKRLMMVSQVTGKSTNLLDGLTRVAAFSIRADGEIIYLCNFLSANERCLVIYNPFINELKKKNLDLDVEPSKMIVNEDSDYIAFLGHNLKEISIYSIPSGKVAFRFCTDSCSYLSGVFLKKIFFVAYNSTLFVLEIFNMVKNQTVLYLKNVSNYHEQDFRYLHLMAAVTSNSLVICDSKINHHKVYKMSFSFHADKAEAHAFSKISMSKRKL